MFKNPTNNNPQNPLVFCNIKWNVPGQALPAPSGTLGKGQLRVRHSSRAQEGRDEPGLSCLSVPGKAGVQLGKLQRGSILSPRCCCAGHYLKPGRDERRGKKRKKNKRKKTQYIKHTQYLYSIQTQFTRIVFRAVLSVPRPRREILH